MLEEMGEFFNNRILNYEEHQINNIAGAKEFYPFTSSCLPMEQNASILDLGCGTGLELEEYFRLNPSAHVLGIDLAEMMLKKFTSKFRKYKIETVRSSFFDYPFGENRFDAVVSVEALHHFPQEKKAALYEKIYTALKSGGYLILTDYFADSDETEQYFMNELKRYKMSEFVSDDVLYHYDTPLTVAHEIEALKAAGFTSVKDLKAWGATHTLKAVKD